MTPEIQSDLKALNLQFLMLVREYARNRPIDAVWIFGMNEADIDGILSMTMDQIQELASCGRAVLKILPSTDTRPNASLNILAALAASARNTGNEVGSNAC